MEHPSQRNLSQWLAYIEQTHHQGIDMGLSRCRDAFKRIFGQQQTIRTGKNDKSIIVSVAGTNGKGTTCRFVEQACLQAGLSVGVYASPHIIRFNERIRINGEEVSDTLICRAFEAIESRKGDISLTYFEYATLAALFLFLSEVALDVIILEVGLGGRLDATNIIDADIGVITSIGLDHQSYLGDTTELIAKEKAGIIKPQQQLVVGYEDMHDSLRALAKKYASYIIARGVDFDDTSITLEGQKYYFDTHKSLIPQPNVMTAIATLHAIARNRQSKARLLINEKDIQALIEVVSVPGRMQIISTDPTIVLDVAHNQAAAELLVKHLRSINFDTCKVVIGMLKDKNIEATLDALSVLQPSKWYCCDLATERGEKASRLSSHLLLEKQGMIAYAVDEFLNVEAAIKKAQKESTKNDLILVVGSFIVAQECMHVIQNKGINAS